MNILVCVKRVPLTGGKIVLTDDQRAIRPGTSGSRSARTRSAAPRRPSGSSSAGGSATALTLGPPEAEEQLRDMMAIGADRAIHLVTDGSEWDPQATASAIVARDPTTSQQLRPDPVRQRVGRRRQLPGADPCRVRARDAVRDRGQGDLRRGRQARCEQEVAGGRDVYVVALPAVVAVREG